MAFFFFFFLSSPQFTNETLAQRSAARPWHDWTAERNVDRSVLKCICIFLFCDFPINHRARGPKPNRTERTEKSKEGWRETKQAWRYETNLSFAPLKQWNYIKWQRVILFTSCSTWRCLGTNCVCVVLWRSRLNWSSIEQAFLTFLFMWPLKANLFSGLGREPSN